MAQKDLKRAKSKVADPKSRAVRDSEGHQVRGGMGEMEGVEDNEQMIQFEIQGATESTGRLKGLRRYTK